MKKHFFISLLIFAMGIVTKANQLPHWVWGRSAGGTGSEATHALTVDRSGNVIVTGAFFSASIIFGTDTLTKAITNSSAIFVVKYDSSGNVIWARKEGGASYDGGYCLVADDSGNVFLGGMYNGQIYLAKYDSVGNKLWEKKNGGGGGFYSGMALDDTGNVYVCGSFFTQTIIIGNDTLVNPGVGYNDILLAKYDASGNPLWALSSGGISYDYGNDIAIDKNGNLILTGSFCSSAITFGTVTLTKPTISLESNMFVVELTPAGIGLWGASTGSASLDDDDGYSVSSDSSGNVFVTGRFSSASLTFGSITIVNHGPLGSMDLYVVKYNSIGNVLWAKSVGGYSDDWGNCGAVDAEGSLLLAGQYRSPQIIFGLDTIVGPVSTQYNILLLKFDTAGNAVWTKQFDGGGLVSEIGTSIAVDPSGNIYFGGIFEDFVVYADTSVLISSGSRDIFVFKLNESDTITGLTTRFDDEFFKVYPNPSCNYIHLIFDKYNSPGIKRLELINVMGEKVLTKDLKERETDIDLSAINQKGIFFLKVMDSFGKKLTTRKIILY